MVSYVFVFQLSLLSFGTFILMGNVLTAEKAFVSMSLFNILRIPLGFLPMFASFIVEVGSLKISSSKISFLIKY